MKVSLSLRNVFFADQVDCWICCWVLSKFGFLVLRWTSSWLLPKLVSYVEINAHFFVTRRFYGLEERTIRELGLYNQTLVWGIASAQSTNADMKFYVYCKFYWLFKECKWFLGGNIISFPKLVNFLTLYKCWACFFLSKNVAQSRVAIKKWSFELLGVEKTKRTFKFGIWRLTTIASTLKWSAPSCILYESSLVENNSRLKLGPAFFLGLHFFS